VGVSVSRNSQIFWMPPIISRTGNVTNFKFGRYIQRVHPKPFKNFGKKGAWAHPGNAQILWYSLLSQKRAKLRTSNFVSIFIASVGTKPIKNFEKSSPERTQGLSKIIVRAPIYRAHHAVIAIAQFSRVYSLCSTSQKLYRPPYNN